MVSDDTGTVRRDVRLEYTRHDWLRVVNTETDAFVMLRKSAITCVAVQYPETVKVLLAGNGREVSLTTVDPEWLAGEIWEALAG